MNDLLNYYNEHKAQVGLMFGIALGLVIGLLVGWVLWPRSVYNATPNLLRQDFRDDYLVWVAQQYEDDRDAESAHLRLGTEFWGQGQLSAALQDLAQRRGGATANQLVALDSALQATAPPTPESASQQGTRPTYLLCGTGLIVAAVAVLGYMGLSRLRARRRTPSERAMASRQMEPASWADDSMPPMAQFVTTYSLGDDFYDPSFSIENENGDFLGECGVGISEAIGVGDPKKVTALEVWLFDKNDIRTVTKVLMSEYAFHDDALRARLASKGDQVLAQEEGEIALETATLTLRAKILEMEYGESQLPTQSFFGRVTLELGIWVKGDEGVVEIDPFDEPI